MITVGVRELKQQASELVRLVRETGSQVQVTYRGKVVALLIPVERSREPEQEAQAWMELDRQAAEIGVRWPAGISAEQAVSEDRR